MLAARHSADRWGYPHSAWWQSTALTNVSPTTSIAARGVATQVSLVEVRNSRLYVCAIVQMFFQSSVACADKLVLAGSLDRKLIQTSCPCYRA